MLVQGKGKGAALDKGKAVMASKGKGVAQAEQPAPSTSGRQTPLSHPFTPAQFADGTLKHMSLMIHTKLHV